MNAVEILSHCRNAGITLAVDAEGKLHASGNKDGIATLREDIKAHKAELVAILQAVPASLPPVVSTPVKYTRRRALASTPPPATLPLTNGQQGPLSFLYSVIRGGVVARGVFISQGIRSEPEALEFLRKRYPELRVQWARLIQHPVCGGCRFYTAAVLCTIDLSPDSAARVGNCGKYERAGEL
jgi:hypothetical protein